MPPVRLTALEIALLEIEVGEAPLTGREIQQVRVPLGEGVEFGEIPEEEEDPRANPVETALEHRHLDVFAGHVLAEHCVECVAQLEPGGGEAGGYTQARVSHGHGAG